MVPDVPPVMVMSVLVTLAAFMLKTPPVPTVTAVKLKVAAPVAVIVAVRVAVVALSVPVEMVIVPAACIKAPLSVKVLAPMAIVVIVEPVESKEAMFAVTSTVTVPEPEFASKKTPLEAVGGLPAPMPPLVDAQCVPSLQFPVPPTQ